MDSYIMASTVTHAQSASVPTDFFRGMQHRRAQVFVDGSDCDEVLCSKYPCTQCFDNQFLQSTQC